MAEERVSSAEPNVTKPAIVKKYANRRLYNTATSSYVTLEELAQMVRDGGQFVVFDAKSGDDITRSVLTQIILEEDSKGRNLLPINFLRQLIAIYDDSLHAFVPRYLEVSMENFARHQHQMRRYVDDTFGRFFPLQQFDEMMRQNMALFQQATHLFGPPDQRSADANAGASGAAGEGQALQTEVEELRAKLVQLQQQLDELSKASTSSHET